MTATSSDAPPLDIILCAPRGFCAGVDRAIEIVETALAKFGAPVYVRHEIVHNRFVVEQLRRDGAVFVENLNEIPGDDADRPVIFSAHGVARAVIDEAKTRNLHFLDATCPLVTKVHRQVRLHIKRGRHVILIGHANHPEVVGTLGQVDDAANITLIETEADAYALRPPTDKPLAWTSQTTLSVDDTAKIVAVLKRRFANIVAPHTDDICYATSNRQMAVKSVAPSVDAMIVVGAENSSNSKRLLEVAQRSGCHNAHLVNRASAIDWRHFADIKSLGVTAGASAPEVLVEEVIESFSRRYRVSIRTSRCVEENISFPLPQELRSPVTA